MDISFFLNKYYINSTVHHNTLTAYGMMEQTQPTAPRAVTTTTNPVTSPPLEVTTTIPDSGKYRNPGIICL
jgi:hypothetical protein